MSHFISLGETFRQRHSNSHSTASANKIFLLLPSIKKKVTFVFGGVGEGNMVQVIIQFFHGHIAVLGQSNVENIAGFRSEVSNVLITKKMCPCAMKRNDTGDSLTSVFPWGARYFRRLWASSLFLFRQNIWINFVASICWIKVNVIPNTGGTSQRTLPPWIHRLLFPYQNSVELNAGQDKKNRSKEKTVI